MIGEEVWVRDGMSDLVGRGGSMGFGCSCLGSTSMGFTGWFSS